MLICRSEVYIQHVRKSPIVACLFQFHSGVSYEIHVLVLALIHKNLTSEAGAISRWTSNASGILEKFKLRNWSNKLNVSQSSLFLKFSPEMLQPETLKKLKQNNRRNLINQTHELRMHFALSLQHYLLLPFRVELTDSDDENISGLKVIRTRMVDGRKYPILRMSDRVNSL